MKGLKIRCGTENSQSVFIDKKQGRVAFIGGSITEMLAENLNSGKPQNVVHQHKNN